jgi:fucose permease
MFIAFSSSRWQLSFTLFFYGVIGNIANISMNTQGLSIQTRLDRPILSGLHAMWSLGAFFAAAMTGSAIKWNVTMSEHYATVAVLTIIVVLAMAAHLITDIQRDGVGTKVFVLPNRPLMLLGIICFCVAMSEGAMADWSSLYYREVVQDISSISTAGYTAFMMCMALGRFAGDRLLQSLTHKQVLKLNGLLILLGMLLALAIQQPLVVMVGFGLVGFGVSSVIPIVYMLSAKTDSMPPSTALAAVSSVGFSGFLFGPPIIGFVAQETGLRIALLIVALLGTLIWWLSLRIRYTK